MTLVKLHACQCIEVKRFSDIGQSTGRRELVTTAAGPTSRRAVAAANSVVPGQPGDLWAGSTCGSGDRHWRSHPDVVWYPTLRFRPIWWGPIGSVRIELRPIGVRPARLRPILLRPVWIWPVRLAWGSVASPPQGQPPIQLPGHRLRRRPPYARLLRLRCRGARLVAGADLAPPLPAVPEGRPRDTATRPMPAGSRRGTACSCTSLIKQSNRNDQRSPAARWRRTPPEPVQLRRSPTRRVSRPRSTAMIPTTRLMRVSCRAWGVRSRSTQRLTKTVRTTKGTGFASRALNTHATLESEPSKVASATRARRRLSTKAPKATQAAGSRSRIKFSTPFSVSTLAVPRGWRGRTAGGIAGQASGFRSRQR